MTDSKSTPSRLNRLSSTLDSALFHGAVERILQSRAVFLDYDGTLTPIVARPELAILSESVRVIIRQLSTSCPVTIVTGRDVDIIRKLVDIEGIGYVGSHGLDIAGPAETGLRRQVGTAFVPELDAMESSLRLKTDGIEGALIERKRFSISVHIRQADPHRHSSVETIIDELNLAHPTLKLEKGKLLYELRPDIDWDKGEAVKWLIEGMSLDLSTTLYIGDDLTDETAFSALGGRGMTVVVAGPHEDRPTAAGFRLNDPSEVEVLLSRLVEQYR